MCCGTNLMFFLFLPDAAKRTTSKSSIDETSGLAIHYFVEKKNKRTLSLCASWKPSDNGALCTIAWLVDPLDVEALTKSQRDGHTKYDSIVVTVSRRLLSSRSGLFARSQKIVGASSSWSLQSKAMNQNPIQCVCKVGFFANPRFQNPVGKKETNHRKKRKINKNAAFPVGFSPGVERPWVKKARFLTASARAGPTEPQTAVALWGCGFVGLWLCGADERSGLRTTGVKLLRLSSIAFDDGRASETRLDVIDGQLFSTTA
ncbi:hypothetical protein BD289DRAFT_290693 [Coniella lustricola]|uniref:Uncharacterized protein n=1 Tax=Coniella lustricola TaxID=2025994 RepID=A0A2T3A5H0_9PEZI|nr:hypothetical protein BD289DRAFT_290693 [Coniella lustricola]